MRPGLLDVYRDHVEAATPATDKKPPKRFLVEPRKVSSIHTVGLSQENAQLDIVPMMSCTKCELAVNTSIKTSSMKDCPYNHRLVDTKSILPAVQKVVAGSSQMQDIIKVSKFFEDSWE
ncbi:hypothetical protein PABG_07682 [Paracoccidioides brasiliensis Pb03]|nr:hypothetical protein PABG_07682 [Paracoccidioides brasiliensis Pb03]